MTLECNVPSSTHTLVGQGFKVMASIGGWNFSSLYFFEMVSTRNIPAKFITSTKATCRNTTWLASTSIWNFRTKRTVTTQYKIQII